MYVLRTRKDMLHIALLQGITRKTLAKTCTDPSSQKQDVFYLLSDVLMCSNGIDVFWTVVVTCPREFALSISMNQSSPSLCVRLFELRFSLLGMRYRCRSES
jgi:hypothetical protein